MKELEGPYTKETDAKLKEMQQEFIPLLQAMKAAEHGDYSGASEVRLDILVPK